MLQNVFVRGLRRSFALHLLAPLYLAGLAIGLLQSWPLLPAIGNGALTNPFLGRAAFGGGDALVDLLLGDPAAGQIVGLWVLAVLPLLAMYSLVYSFIAGGVLSAYARKRSFWAGCRRMFWPFVAVSLIMLVPTGLAIGVAALLGGVAGFNAGLLGGALLLQWVNLAGEYARAAAVAHDRLNPFVLVATGFGFCARHAGGVLTLGLAGLLLHSCVTLMYALAGGAAAGTLLVIVVQQAAVLAWLWVKLLRLAWALSYVEAATLVPAPELARATKYVG